MYSVLIADDNKDWIDILDAKISQDPSFNIIAKAYDGKEAIKVVEAERPEIVILDIIMPEFDGAYIVNHIRSEMRGYDPVIYIISGIGWTITKTS